MIDQKKIHKQCLSKNPIERNKALNQLIDYLRDYFSLQVDKQQSWNDLIKLTNDKDKWVRSRAASVLGSVFSDVSDKQQVWNDLIKLTNNKDKRVRSKVAPVLGSAFYGVPDKQQAWNDLVPATK